MLRLARGLGQHHLVVLDDVAGKKGGVVRHQLTGWKRLHLPQQGDRHPLRPRHRLIVKGVLDDSRRRLPRTRRSCRMTVRPLLSRPGTVT